MVRRIIVLLAVMAALLAGKTASFAAAADVNEQDRTFLIQTHQGNLGEIRAGRLAETEGSKKAVREFGTRLVTDHTKLDKVVRQVALQLGVKLPHKPSDKQQAELKQIAVKQGAEFDRAWIAAMIADHKEDLAAIAQQLSKGSSAQVKKIATDSKPVVQDHLQTLQKLQRG
ncbi:DUF4142 domain-containing protein [Planotetraspora sp. A-T 1434]|uniref:DUF4142 domain-containing protein n=1 Tax=Planotetraspora sp. A-T 1434 TaxID=2979219 RepID=UPI0021C0F2DF|nr:DUF4142 domain-containing protein [Planotetraspora sp. A-T 1434]MCT9931684.1 DUF4142 domain-containing protein [Planotetraspora sp. A-T 1434]